MVYQTTARVPLHVPPAPPPTHTLFTGKRLQQNIEIENG
jgi:hypothetical protein